jgi:hypothetical protein
MNAPGFLRKRRKINGGDHYPPAHNGLVAGSRTPLIVAHSGEGDHPFQGKLLGSDLAARIDASRCTEYEKALGLKISSSPHLVVTTKRPTPTTSLGDYVLLELGDLSPESTEKLMTKLADGLVAGNLSAEELNSAKWWLSWRDVATDVLRGLAEVAAHIKVKIKSEFVDVEIDGHK